MYELGEICTSVDAESITVIPLRPQVREAGMKDHMATAREFRRVLEDLVGTKDKLGIRFTTTMETDYVEYCVVIIIFDNIKLDGLRILTNWGILDRMLLCF